MRRSFKRLFAAVLFLMAVVWIPTLISAEGGETDLSNVEQVEANARPDIYQVILPMDTGDVFDFILDPQKLIEETNAAAYDNKKFEKGSTVFFRRRDGQTDVEYSSSSDRLTITNKSTVPVEVRINADIDLDSLGNIKMSGDRGFANDMDASLYMALTDGEQTVPIKTENSCIQATIPAAPENAFEYKYDREKGEYTCELREDLSGIQFPEYSFQLTGAANEKGDWSGLGDIVIRVNVTWEVWPNPDTVSGEKKDPDQTMHQEQSVIPDPVSDTVPVENETVEELPSQHMDSGENGNSSDK